MLLEFYHCPAEHWIHLHTTNHRIYFRDSAFEEQGHQGAWLADGWVRDGVPADRCRPGTLARCERAAPGRPRSGRSRVREGQTHRTTGRFVNYAGGRLTLAHPQGFDNISCASRRVLPSGAV